MDELNLDAAEKAYLKHVSQNPADPQTAPFLNMVPAMLEECRAIALARMAVGDDGVASPDVALVKMQENIDRLEVDNSELRALFELQHSRSRQAGEHWRRETGQDALPDLGVLLKWLMDKAGLESDRTGAGLVEK